MTTTLDIGYINTSLIKTLLFGPNRSSTLFGFVTAQLTQKVPLHPVFIVAGFVSKSSDDGGDDDDFMQGKLASRVHVLT